MLEFAIGWLAMIVVYRVVGRVRASRTIDTPWTDEARARWHDGQYR